MNVKRQNKQSFSISIDKTLELPSNYPIIKQLVKVKNIMIEDEEGNYNK